MIGVQDEDSVHRLFDRRVHFIRLGGNAEGHAQEVAGVGQRVVRVQEGLADAVLVRHRRDRRDLGDQAVRGDGALDRIVDVGRVVIEGRQRADDAAHDCHRVRIAAEATEERRQLFMHHGVARDRVGEARQLVRRGQLAVQQQIGDFHKARLFGEFADRIAAMQQNAFVTVDIGQLRLARRRRGEPRIVGEVPGLRVELADVDDVRSDSAGHDRVVEILAVHGYLCGFGHLVVLPIRLASGPRCGRDFPLCRATRARRKCRARSCAR